MGWIPIATAALGAVAGSQAKKQEQSFAPGAETALGSAAARGTLADYEAMRGLVGAGAGQADVTAGAQSQRDLASMLQDYSKGGFLPGQQDWATANQFAQTAFQPQQVALQQQQKQEQLKANQLAAQLGRPVNDPIIQSKLAQERMQQQERLGASQGAYASQFALNLPQQRLGYTAQLADVRNALASQAMSNRQAILNMGNQIQSAERSWRLGTGTTTSTSGGGMAGAISGGLAGLGTGLSIANMFGGGGGGNNTFDLAGANQQIGAISSGYSMPEFGKQSIPSFGNYLSSPINRSPASTTALGSFNIGQQAIEPGPNSYGPAIRSSDLVLAQPSNYGQAPWPPKLFDYGGAK